MASFVPAPLPRHHSKTATKATVSGQRALSKLDEQLRCAVCFDRYTDPRILPCHHIFCKKCIDQFPSYSRQQFTTCFVRFCPTCRKQFQLGVQGAASSLPVAFPISNLLEIEDDLKIENHEFQVCQAIDKYGQAHRRPKDMYCDTCEKYVCLKCTLESHHSHQCDRAEFLFTQHKQQIEASLEPMKKKMDKLKQTLTRFDTREKELKAQEKALQEEISKAHQLLMNQLGTKGAYASGDVMHSMHSCSDKIHTHKYVIHRVKLK